MTRGAYAFLLAAMICMGAVYAIPNQLAFAHNFSGDESASFLAKVQELRVETHLIEQNLSNQTLVAWHIDKSGEFWNANDTKEMAERNQRLSKEIPDGLSALFQTTNSTSPDAAKVKQIVDALDGSLAEAVTARIDQASRNNATVGALAIANVLDETLEDYGIASGAEEEEGGSMDGNTSMSQENNSETNASATGNETASTDIVNVAAYQTAQGLAGAAQNMFNDLKARASENATSSISKIDQGFNDLRQTIGNKASNDDVTGIIHGTIMSNLQTAFNLQVVPEFPLPLLMIIPAIAGIIAASRFSAMRKR